VVTGTDALWRSVPGFRGETLDLDQHGPRAFEKCGNRASRRIAEAIAEEQLGRILDGDQSFLCHAKDADLIDATKAVLGCAKDAVLQHSLALEVQDRVDDVLERLRSGDAATLGDVADRKHRRFRLLCEAHQTRGALADLSDVAGRALEIE